MVSFVDEVVNRPRLGELDNFMAEEDTYPLRLEAVVNFVAEVVDRPRVGEVVNFMAEVVASTQG